MNLIETELKLRSCLHRSAITDADVIREIAEIWVDSGGDSGGLDDEYVGKLRAEVKRLEGGAA